MGCNELRAKSWKQRSCLVSSPESPVQSFVAFEPREELSPQRTQRATGNPAPLTGARGGLPHFAVKLLSQMPLGTSVRTVTAQRDPEHGEAASPRSKSMNPKPFTTKNTKGHEGSAGKFETADSTADSRLRLRNDNRQMDSRHISMGESPFHWGANSSRYASHFFLTSAMIA